MAIFVLTDCSIWVHDQDLATVSNKVTLKMSVDELDATVFASGGTHQRVGGLRNIEANCAGYADTTAAPDAAAFNALGVTDRAVTISPSSPTTTPAYMFQAAEFDYETFGGVGEVCPMSLTMKNTNKTGVVRGAIAAGKTTVNATGVLGVGLNLGPGTGKSLYATLHVFTAGTTLTVVIESAPTSGFATPTTRATIGPLTTTGGTFLTPVPVGAVTDPWWRFKITTITGSFTVAGAIAVQ